MIHLVKEKKPGSPRDDRNTSKGPTAEQGTISVLKEARGTVWACSALFPKPTRTAALLPSHSAHRPSFPHQASAAIIRTKNALILDIHPNASGGALP